MRFSIVGVLGGLTQVEELPDDEQMTVIKFVGAYFRDSKTKQAYASYKNPAHWPGFVLFL